MFVTSWGWRELLRRCCHVLWAHVCPLDHVPPLGAAHEVGARGFKIRWIGIHFSLRWREGILDNEVPEKLRDELLEKLVGQLRTFAGKLTWAAGICKPARWGGDHGT